MSLASANERTRGASAALTHRIGDDPQRHDVKLSCGAVHGDSVCIDARALAHGDGWKVTRRSGNEKPRMEEGREWR